MKPPPPMPHAIGSTTPSMAAAATAASVALPPRASVSIAVWLARRSTVAAAPPRPTRVGGSEAGAAAGVTAAIAMAATAAAITRMRRSFPERRSFTPRLLEPHPGLAGTREPVRHPHALPAAHRAVVVRQAQAV